MAKNDPQFVRLSDITCHGIMVDVEGGSLFSLSGMEVKPFPDADVFPDQARFVRDKIRVGHIEEASEEEYKEQKEAAAQIKATHVAQLQDRLASDTADVQEGDVQTLVRGLQNRIVARRNGKDPGPLDDGMRPGELEEREEKAQEAARAAQESSQASTRGRGKAAEPAE